MNSWKTVCLCGKLDKMRDPEWFLAKIAAGLAAAGISPEAPAPVRKLSRVEIDSIVTTTVNEEIARLNAQSLPRSRDQDLKGPSGPARRTGP